MTDKELIDRWLDGDSRAATELVKRHKPLVTAMAVKSVRFDEVDELVQDTFVRAFEALRSYRGDKASFSSWLLVIQRNLVIDRARVEQRRREYIAIEDVADSLSAGNYTALDQIVADETEQRLLSIGSLREREILQLRMRGERFNAIGRELGLNAESARVQFHRVRAAIQTTVRDAA